MTTRTKTVAAFFNNETAIPGLDDLLISSYDHPNFKRAAQAAANELEPVLQGIVAIGELLWRSADRGRDSEDLSAKTMHGIGVLLIHLAEFAQAMNFYEGNARHYAENPPPSA